MLLQVTEYLPAKAFVARRLRIQGVHAGTALRFVLSSFAALNVAFTVVWFFIAAALAREYKNRSAQAARKEASHETEKLHQAVSSD